MGGMQVSVTSVVQCVEIVNFLRGGGFQFQDGICTPLPPLWAARLR